MHCMGKQKGAGNELSEVLAGFIILVFLFVYNLESNCTVCFIPPCAPDVHRKCAEICESKSLMRRADSHSTPPHCTHGRKQETGQHGGKCSNNTMPSPCCPSSSSPHTFAHRRCSHVILRPPSSILCKIAKRRRDTGNHGNRCTTRCLKCIRINPTENWDDSTH